MHALANFDEMYVISDLHLGGSPGFQMFDQGELLAKLILSLRDRPGRRNLALLINGDFVDFLAEANPHYFDPVGAVGKLQRIASDASFGPVFDALRQFVLKANRTLIINLGNHDLELALPWVRHWLLAELSSGQDRARGRIQLVFDGTGYLCRVGDASVLCVHGNDADAWNVCDYDALRQIGRDGNMGRQPEPWTPNAGTKLVIDVMNTIKRDFPFVDLLKPEVAAVVPTLLALNPEAKPKLNQIFGVAGKLASDKVRRAFAFLDANVNDAKQGEAIDGEDAVDALLDETFGPPSDTRPADADVESLLAATEASMTAGAVPMDLVSQRNPSRKLGAVDALAAWFQGKEKSEILREALEQVTKDRSFDLKHVDNLCSTMDHHVANDIDFIVTGHTHLERALVRHAGHGFYYNSGTWARLIRLTEDVLGSPEHFRRYYKAFEKGTLAALDREKNLILRRPTVVSITSESPVTVGRLNRVSFRDDDVALQVVEGSEFEKG